MRKIKRIVVNHTGYNPAALIYPLIRKLEGASQTNRNTLSSRIAGPVRLGRFHYMVSKDGKVHQLRSENDMVHYAPMGALEGLNVGVLGDYTKNRVPVEQEDALVHFLVRQCHEKGFEHGNLDKHIYGFSELDKNAELNGIDFAQLRKDVQSHMYVDETVGGKHELAHAG